MAETQTAGAQSAGGRRTKPPFRADHVGSLLRPRSLLQAREEFAAGRLPAEDLHALEDDAIRDVVKMQRDVGLQSATDGEFRRASWHMDFIYQLGGIEKVEGDIKVKFRNAEGEIDFTPAAIAVTDRVHLDHTIFAADFEFLKSTVDEGVTPKLTVPSPNMVHYRGGRAALDPSVYPDVDQFWSDLSSAYADQVRAIAGLGCTYLQFDDTSLAYLNDPHQREAMEDRGEDSAHLHETYVRNINNALAGRPEGLAITTHLCRGNFRSSWAAEGGYDFVAEALFGGLDVDGFFLEYDDARSGGFEPLRFVAPGKMVVLGLVTSKRGELESKDDLKRRIEEASRFVPVEQLCLSPQCGFSSTFEGNALTRDEQAAKLQLIVETAAEVWGEMRAAVTERVGAMRLLDRPDPPDPGPGEVLLAPEAVGICGSDYHFFAGELSDAAGGSQFPRVQGHEVGATIAALGRDCRGELEVGQRVALMPIRACGHCYPCSVGRPNACDNFELIGIHVDGGLQELLCTGQDQVFPIGAADGALAAMAEPVSIAVRAVRRARIESGERVVVLGAGPIGQCVALVASEQGADVLVIDLQPSRLERSKEIGVETLLWSNAEDVVRQARQWGGPGGPPVGIDATGVPAAVRAMVDVVASAGRAVQVGMSNSEVTLRIGSLTEKEIDLLGVSCCDAHDFADAVAVVERNGEAIRRLVSHEFPLTEAPDALRFAMNNPTEVMKVVIWNG